MNTARDDQWADRDCTAEGEHAAWPARTRRALLGGAAGGFALAASGLILPDWLAEDTEAADHPARRVQGRKDKRRHKRRHKKRHKHQRRKAHSDREREEQDNAPGINLRSGIIFYISNDSASPSHVDSYAYLSDGFFQDKRWRVGASPTIQPGETYPDRTGNQESAILIENRYWILADNPLVGWPTIDFRYGGTVKPESSAGYTGGTTVIWSMGFVVGFAPVVRTVEGRRFTIQRIEDQNTDFQNHVVFTIHYT